MLSQWVEVGGSSDYRGHNNNYRNLMRAITERVFNVQRGGQLVPTPKPKDGWWDANMDGYVEAVRSRVVSGANRDHELGPLTVEEFLDQCPKSKLKIYDAAAKTYQTRGWITKDAWLKLFVKFEKINFTKKPDPAPRLISPRSPVYNLALGRYTRAIEEKVYEALADIWGYSDGEKVVMKGLTVEGTAEQLRKKWDKYSDPVAVGLDASRFDQHISEDALIFEHSIYKAIFRSEELDKLLKAQLRNYGFAYHGGYKIEMRTKGVRASGDMNTGLGNCTIMCTLVHRMSVEFGISCDLVNNGDDCVIILERTDLWKLMEDGKIRDDIEAWFLDAGFEMEFEPPVDVFEQIVFCQMQPVWNGTKWVMVRQPEVALCKDSICLGCSTMHEYGQWARSIGVGGLALYGDMPVYRAFYSCFNRLGEGYKPSRSLLTRDSGFYKLCVRGRNHTGVVTPEARVSFYRAFGITPALQEVLEEKFQNVVLPTKAIKAAYGVPECVGSYCGP